jgi:hypothetical protein
VTIGKGRSEPEADGGRLDRRCKGLEKRARMPRADNAAQE